MTRAEAEGRPRAGRLVALDLLRGADMVLLTVVGPLVAALSASFDVPACVRAQFRHGWGGFTLWDMIMPLFIFMTGAAVPLAMRRRLENGRATWRWWRHVLFRAALLWLLGMVAQGRLLALDASKISPFNNTLQAIACGYLAASAALLVPSRRIRAAIPVLLALGYSLLLHFGGGYSPETNAAMRFERWFVPLVTPSGSQALALADPGYTWWATIPMFAATALFGMEASEILAGGGSRTWRLARLSALGAALLAAGFALSPVVPPIKHIFTVSFTAAAAGCSCLALAALSLLADIPGVSRACGPVALFGRHALLAYMCREAFRPAFDAFGAQFAPGFAHLLGAWAGPPAAWLASTLLLVAVLVLADSAGKRAF